MPNGKKLARREVLSDPWPSGSMLSNSIIHSLIGGGYLLIMLLFNQPNINKFLGVAAKAVPKERICGSRYTRTDQAIGAW
jgi:hypothetical protein